jgi:RimJ/RimL family protein N-acetyltransferase
MSKDDVASFARWYQDLEFTAFFAVPGEAQTVEMRQEIFDKNSRPRPDSIEFSVLLLNDSQLVGFGGLFDISRAGTASLFVGIGEREFQNGGLGTEATRLICEYGFFFRSLHAIKVEVNSYNQRALRVYERIGFKLVGRLRGAILLNGRRHDQVLMDLTREEFEPRFLSRFGRLEGVDRPSEDRPAVSGLAL